MRHFSANQLSPLLAEQQPPCISLYQPTHRRYPDNQQDPIRYRNLLTELEKSLGEHFPAQDVRSVMEKFHDLARDKQFWNYRTEGLAVLGSPEQFQVFDLQRPLTELLVVAESFHIKPLLRVLQSADRFHILCLTRREAEVYEGNRDTIDVVELPQLPLTIEAALGTEHTEPHQTVLTYGMGPVGGDMRHGHGAKKDEVDIDIERFFRIVDREIHEHLSKPSRLPLILAALPEYHTPFRAISHNPQLVEEGIAIDPQSLTAQELRQLAWRIMEPTYQARLAQLVEDFNLARSRQLGTDDVAKAFRAAREGRVAVLLIEADRPYPGQIDPGSGKLVVKDPAEPDTDDILDDLAETVLRMKGEAIVVPKDRMPTSTGVAATYRY